MKHLLSPKKNRTDRSRDQYRETRLQVDNNFDEIRAMIEELETAGDAVKAHVTVSRCSLEDYLWLRMKQDNGRIHSLILTDVGRQIFPTVSLVMFTYNRIEYTREALMTLMHNTRYPFDLVIIDNFSTDGTREWLEEVRRRYAHRIKNIIYNSCNEGLPGPTNEFWQGVKADLVGKVDNDTLVPEGWLEKLVEAHTKLPKLAVVGGYHYRPEDFDENAAQSKLYREGGICLLPDTHIGGCCYLMKKSVQEKYGLMDVHPTLKTHGWTQYQWRLLRAGYLIGYLYPLIQLEYMDDPRSEKCLIESRYKEYAREIWKERGVKFQSSDQLVSWIRNDAARVIKSLPSSSSSACIQKNLVKRRDAPLVSIVILTHNQLAYTRICLDSIRRETGLPVELIVVDNGSSDGTVRYLETMKERQRSIALRVIPNKTNLGFAAGNNQGIAMARGRYILLMNNDVAVTPGWLERMIVCAETHPRAGIVGPKSNYVSGPQLVKNVDYNTQTLEGLTTFAKRFAVENAQQATRILRVVGFCMLIRREVINKIGALDNRFGLGNFEDDDFSLRAGLAGFESWIAEDCFVHHFGSRTFTGAKIDYHAILKRNWQIFKKKWGMPDTLPYGSPYRLAEIASDGFDPEKHYVRLPKPSVPADATSERDDGEMRDRSKRSIEILKKADILAQKGQVDMAVKVLFEGIRLSPNNKNIYYAIAGILINDRQYNAAIGVLKEVPCDDDDPKKLELTGYCLEGLNQDDEAGEYADMLLDLDRDSAAALNLKGVVTRKKDREREAEDYFRKAIAADEGYGMAYSNLGALWQAGDNKDEALDLLEKGFILSPTNHDVLTLYHNAAITLRTFERAEKVFRTAFELNPYHKMIHFQLIDLLLRQQKYEQAMDEIEKAIVQYGADEGVVSAALNVRKRLGPRTIKGASTKKGTVSLCMIVKNEVQYIGKCLMNLKPLADEMIVVDTGSSDRTKALAEIFGAKIYDFKWNDDFSDARNYSVSKAQGDWILVMDADEIISPRDYKAFKKLIRKKHAKILAYSFVTRNYEVRTNIIGINPNKGAYQDEEAGYGWIPSKKVRLFKNGDHIRFEYPVHERVEPFLKRKGIRIKECAIPVHHYGKLNKASEARKGDKYFRMGMKKLEKAQDDAMAVFELAVQAGGLEKWEEAIELWQRYNRLRPHVPAAHLNMGTAYQKIGRLDKAIQSAKRAMEIDPGMTEAPNNYALYKIYEGNAEGAISVLEDLVNQAPEYLPARFKLAVAYCCAGKKEDGLKELQRLEQTSIGPGLAAACQSIARELASLQHHNYAKSVRWAATEMIVMSPLCRGMQDRRSQNDVQAGYVR
jgi:GT2 family glycosyltransferase/tetratricopeptide (TPR) repeat protein